MFKDVCFAHLQYIIPQHLLSRLIGKLAASHSPLLKDFLIKLAIKKFKINLSDALIEDPKKYKTFNDFFTRKLKPNARIFPKNNKIIASPADGMISQIGKIQSGEIFQAKGHMFSTLALLGGNYKEALKYQDGHFFTIYLAPKDYHRVHMPVSGKLVSYTHIPGQLFSVNTATANHIPNLFARNERVCFFFESDEGPFVIIMVGAMLVASIGTPFTGILKSAKSIFTKKFTDPILLNQGDELGFFQFGSTAIVLFPSSRDFTPSLQANDTILCGEKI